MARKRYDCLKCSGYCCSYDDIPISPSDVKRLAKHLKLEEEKLLKKYVEKREDGGFYLRSKPDKYFGRICVFLHSHARICTLYKNRPKVCRDYPHKKHCGYYELLKFERDLQKDEEYVVQVKM